MGHARRSSATRRGALAVDVIRAGRLVAVAIGVAAFTLPMKLPALQGSRPTAARPPWTVGEYLEYTLKVGPISAGSGRMQVMPMDTVRGRPVWRFRFDFSGGWLFFRVNDVFESWLDVETFNSLKFEQHLREPGGNRDRLYQIFPDRAKFRLNNEEERESVREPLDEATFFFFIRTIPLEVGKSYDFNRYFDPKANPVTIRVLRKEKLEVPAGKFDAIVIQPMFKTNGIFSEGGHAELWLSDDDRRILLQMKTKIPVAGSLNLYLRKFSLPALNGSDSTRTSRP